MPDFSRPEYASYIELCRDLKLERAIGAGDYFANFWRGWQEYEVKLASKGQATVMSGFVGPLPVLQEGGGSVWLPTLSDWLEILAREGFPDIAIGEFGSGPWRAYRIDPSPNGWQVADDAITDAPTKEEAAARLWIAVRAPAEA